MMAHLFLWVLFLCFSFQPLWAVSDLAPAVPDLALPASVPQEDSVEQVNPAAQAAASRAARTSGRRPASSLVTNTVSKANTEEISIENLMPFDQQTFTLAQVPASANADAMFPPAPSGPVSGQPAVTPQEAAPLSAVAPETQRVQYNPSTDRDPTLSPDDTLLLKHREEERFRALEAERRRKQEEERRRLLELERQRQLELERLRDPSREIRGRIRVNGIIGQEVFIGNRIYSVGQTILGARIVEVRPDSVVFTYKGQRFIKNVELK